MTADNFIRREQEVSEAHSIFPDLEIGEAYRKYKEAKGEEVTMLSTGDPDLEKAKKAVLEIFHRNCNQPNCNGRQTLEGVCDGCIEGKAGYKSKWTCEVCMYRELSKRPYLDWYGELTRMS